MNRCLGIYEILVLIAQYIVEDGHEGLPNADHEALTAMALACKDFLEPAMDASWHTVDARCLVWTFPPDIVSSPDYGEFMVRVSLHGQIEVLTRLVGR